jgi:hypothetical protein
MTTLQRRELAFLQDRFTTLAMLMLASAAESQGNFWQAEEAVGAIILALRSPLVESALRTSVDSSDRGYVCPDCGVGLRRWDRQDREVVTGHGAGMFTSSRYRCPSCRNDYRPVEEANGLVGNRFTMGAKLRIGQRAAEVPYAVTSSSLSEWGLEVSAKEVDRTVAEVSSWRQSEEREALEAAFPEDGSIVEEQRGAASGPKLFDWRDWSSREPMLMSVDGATIRSPEKGDGGLLWFEGRSALMRPARQKSRARPFYLSGVYTCDALFDHTAAAYRQGPNEDRWVLFIADGARWIWERVRLYFPNRTEVLDIYHAGEHVAGAGIACFGEGSLQAQDWRRRARSMLLEEDCGRVVLGHLARLLREDAGLANRDEVITEFRYFWSNRHRMRYQALLTAGLPIGSGAMESAIKQVSTQRLRQPGMKWSRRGAHDMLCMRAAHLSGALHATVQSRAARLQQDAQRYHARTLQAAA